MTQTYELSVHDTRQVIHQQFANPGFKDQINYTPYKQFNKARKCVWTNFMLGDWAWEQAVSLCQTSCVNYIFWYFFQDIIVADPLTHGSTFIPVVSGSDKTTVSVATRHQVYQSPGSFTNTGCWAHGLGLMPVVFLPIPKGRPRWYLLWLFCSYMVL